ncbi:MAG: Gfo/Idh/MocA family oxidoreductase [Bacilli bacterium]|nr:Gfo/Idh/MocA family oxidoreductase [Bacilli bacterium]
MKKIRIGIIAPSEIAFRRFLPSLVQLDIFEFVGVAISSIEEWLGEKKTELLLAEKEKANNFVGKYGGIVFEGYEAMLKSDLIEAVYIPLPPGLHYYWAKKALMYNKHVLVEKPSTTNYLHTKELLDLANEKQLALHENYMFVFHSQIDYVKKLIKENFFGKIRLITINFGFPFRGANDFRYNKSLGGGALLDCGGYTLKLAKILLGDSCKVVNANSGFTNDYEVDIYGSAMLRNDSGIVANIAFGMDNTYKCDLEIWGSKASLLTKRILTAPDDYKPIFILNENGLESEVTLESDKAFMKSIKYFHESIINEDIRKTNYQNILNQSELVQDFMDKASSK